MEAVIANIRKMSRYMAYLYFEKRDYARLQAYLSDSISWVGTGKYEICHNKEEAQHFFMEEQRVYQGVFTITNDTYRVIPLNTCTVIAICLCRVQPQDRDALDMCEDMRFSLLWTKEDDEWKISHVHASIPDSSLDETNYFNLNPKELKSAGIQLASRYDTLTGIRNMEGFVKEAERLLKDTTQAYALIRFNICNFRFINHQYGYAFGDDILKSIAHNLSLSCQDTETCARIEKDTFVMLYHLQDKEKMYKRMYEVKSRLLDCSSLRRLKQKVQYTAGIYILEKDNKENIKSMMDKAAFAMKYVENTLDSSKFMYYESWMLQKKNRDDELLEQAKAAMQNQDFKLVIQPQMQLEDDRIVSGEALSRWTLPDGTAVAPDGFISLFEKYGLISKYDFYVLHLLCKTMQRWIRENRKIFPISVNQSRTHLTEPNYIEYFIQVVDSYQIPHELIVFELTESAFTESEKLLQHFMMSLKNAGFQIAIDDFGTGFSGISLLSRVNADILKVDKSLLNGINTSRRQMTIFWKIIEMAHSIGMRVICEGVETKEQLNDIRLLKCDIAQGYLIGKPIPLEEFEEKFMSPTVRI